MTELRPESSPKSNREGGPQDSVIAKRQRERVVVWGGVHKTWQRLDSARYLIFPHLGGVGKTIDTINIQTQHLTTYRRFFSPAVVVLEIRSGEEVSAAPRTAGDPWETVYPGEGQC